MPGHTLDFRVLKQAVSVARVLEARGLSGNLRRRGNHLVGPCPIHQGDNPSAFVIDLGKNVWHCFTACAGGGDVVELVRRIDRVGYAEAAHRLAAIAALPVPTATMRPPASPGPGSRQPFRPYTRSLALDPSAPFLRAKGITSATARRFEAGQWHGYGFLGGCIGVRLHDIAGCPLGYTGRRLDSEDIGRFGKWKLPRGFPKSEVLYGAHRLPVPAPRGVVVTECPWGAMRLHQLGIPAVALLGTTLMQKQRLHLHRFQRIVLALDGDRAGVAAAQRIQSALSKSTDVRVAVLPDGKDPDELTDHLLYALLCPLLLL